MCGAWRCRGTVTLHFVNQCGVVERTVMRRMCDVQHFSITQCEYGRVKYQIHITVERTDTQTYEHRRFPKKTTIFQSCGEKIRKNTEENRGLLEKIRKNTEEYRGLLEKIRKNTEEYRGLFSKK